MPGFSVYVDQDAKKSTTLVGRPAQATGLQRGIVGKSFHSTKKSVQGCVRKVLGEVNAPCKPLNETHKECGLKYGAPVKKLLQTAPATEKRAITQKTVQCKPKEQLEESYEEIEQMFPYDEEKEDDYEDLYPKAERPSTHIQEFFDWRPESLFTSRKRCNSVDDMILSFEDLEEEELVRERDCDRLDDMELFSIERMSSPVGISDNLWTQLV